MLRNLKWCVADRVPRPNLTVRDDASSGNMEFVPVTLTEPAVERTNNRTNKRTYERMHRVGEREAATQFVAPLVAVASALRSYVHK